MTNSKLTKHSFKNILVSILPYVLLIAVAAICYMSIAHLLGYYNDDWYLIYAGVSQGAEKFHDVFAIDRPLRGYFVGWMFELFWSESLAVQLGGIFDTLSQRAGGTAVDPANPWPQERKTIYGAVSLFIVYPGFLDQPNAIDFQSHLWGFTLAITLHRLHPASYYEYSKKQTKAVFIVLSLGDPEPLSDAHGILHRFGRITRLINCIFELETETMRTSRGLPGEYFYVTFLRF